MASSKQLKETRKKLLEIIGCSPSRLSQLVSEIAERGPMTREQATLVLAHERGVNLSKYVDSEDLAFVRSMTIRVEPAMIQASSQKAKPKSKPLSPQRNKSKKVFVVHGHNEKVKTELSEFLTSLRLKPIILHEQANKGRTIIKKFEDHADEVACAVVILTPDDIGGENVKKPRLQERARQNVIFELGFFCGKLTRAYVPTLYTEGIELPSDFEGVVYIPLDDVWKENLSREFVAMGLIPKAESI